MHSGFYEVRFACEQIITARSVLTWYSSSQYPNYAVDFRPCRTSTPVPVTSYRSHPPAFHSLHLLARGSGGPAKGVVAGISGSLCRWRAARLSAPRARSWARLVSDWGHQGLCLRVLGTHFGHNFAHILHAQWRAGHRGVNFRNATDETPSASPTSPIRSRASQAAATATPLPQG
jgi:hypothetical protein